MLTTLLEKLSASPLVTDSTCPFKAQTHPVSQPKVLLIVGPNSSGKSLVFQQMAAWSHQAKVSPITLSIRERSGGGTFEMANMRRMMIFGDESEQSTGATSTRVLISGFKNIQGRSENSESVLLMIDEPEMGLSESYAAAMGELIGEETLALPSGSPGVVLVTHSKALVRRLLATLGEQHIAVVAMGATEPMSVQGWLDHTEHHTVAELRALVALGSEGRRSWDGWKKARHAKPTAAVTEAKADLPANLSVEPLTISDDLLAHVASHYAWEQPISLNFLRAQLDTATILKEAAAIENEEQRDDRIENALMDAVEKFQHRQRMIESFKKKKQPAKPRRQP